MAAEDVDPERHASGLAAGRHLALDRSEVARQHARRPVAARILQRDVGGTVTTLRVAGHPPRPARRLNAGDSRYRLGHVPHDERHVLDAARVVEALQLVPRPAVGVGHHEHRGILRMGFQQAEVGGNHRHDVDPGLRVTR